jgi:hypothetical protein
MSFIDPSLAHRPTLPTDSRPAPRFWRVAKAVPVSPTKAMCPVVVIQADDDRSFPGLTVRSGLSPIMPVPLIQASLVWLARAKQSLS